MDRTNQAFGVKQFVAVVQNNRGRKFMVFETGDPKFYLFSAITDQGIATGLQFPVQKSRLQDDIRSALRNGWGNAGISP